MKIEIETPFVPMFVADWIEPLYGQGFSRGDLLEALFTRNYDIAEPKIFRWFNEDKERAVIVILYGYEVEKEPVYYARMKGSDLVIDETYTYWHKALGVSKLGLGDKHHKDIVFKTKMTKEEWNELGINDTNADFEEVV